MAQPLALIIEDDDKLATIFSLALQAVGFDIRTAQDGQTALAELADCIPTLVILDLHLPHVSGKEILNYIRADSRLTDTRVLLATADALMAENLRAEADLVLLKPISIKQLRDLAQRLIASDSDEMT